MRPFFGPLHLLLLAESFAHHFIHRRFHKPGRDRFSVAISLAVIRDQMLVVHDIRAQRRQRLDQSRIPAIGRAEGRNRALQLIDLTQRFVERAGRFWGKSTKSNRMTHLLHLSLESGEALLCASNCNSSSVTMMVGKRPSPISSPSTRTTSTLSISG